jgi:hypothetical protein
MGEKLKARRSRRLRQLIVVLGSCLVLYCLIFLSRTPVGAGPTKTRPQWTLPDEVLENLGLDEEQCDSAFPGLTTEIDDTVSQGSFSLKQTGDSGPLQGRIKDGKLYIIHAQRRADLSTEMLNVSSFLFAPKPPIFLALPVSLPHG